MQDGSDLNLYQQVLVLSKRVKQIKRKRKMEFEAEQAIVEQLNISGSDEDLVIRRKKLAEKYEGYEDPLAIAKRELANGDLTYLFSSFDKG